VFKTYQRIYLLNSLKFLIQRFQSKEAEEIFVLVSKDLIASSERRLTFDPKELSEQLDQRKPIDNEPTERVKLRLAVAESQGLNTLERIIACNDLMPVNYLEKGMDAARAVGRIHKRDFQSGNLLDYATGFLISPQLLLTNHHVFASSDEAQLSEIEFNYQHNKDGTWMGSEFFALQPDTFFFADEELDFAVVAVAQTARQSGKPLADKCLPVNISRLFSIRVEEISNSRYAKTNCSKLMILRSGIEQIQRQVLQVHQFLTMFGKWLLCIIQEYLKKMPMGTI
jgi:hypothetical protein